MINQYFKRSEFACKCGCGFDAVDYELLKLLVSIREYFDKPLIITSACRCEAHNEAEGGETNSQHLFGKAADFYVKDVDIGDLYAYVLSLSTDKYGLGLYVNRLHLDVRYRMVRWVIENPNK